jgi:hypothetical protein
MNCNALISDTEFSRGDQPRVVNLERIKKSMATTAHYQSAMFISPLPSWMIPIIRGCRMADFMFNAFRYSCSEVHNE